jgi:TRAP-type C4-dicarboxylate transport system permease small subunit
MIQRIQSLWLVIVAITAFATSQLTLYVGTLPNGTELPLKLAANLLLVIVVIILGLLALICLFLYKNRKLQFKLSVLGVVLYIGFLFLEYYVVENSFKPAHGIVTGSYQIGAILPILMVVFFFLAARGIYKDEKLVKSMDRLR